MKSGCFNHSKKGRSHHSREESLQKKNPEQIKPTFGIKDRDRSRVFWQEEKEGGRRRKGRGRKREEKTARKRKEERKRRLYTLY